MPERTRLRTARPVLALLLLFALSAKWFGRFFHKKAAAGATVYAVEGMHCSHCESEVREAVEAVEGVESASASASRKTLEVKGTAAEEDIRAAVEKAGFTFKGKKD